MLLTITTTHTPATDLGYLLYKHPERVQEFSLTFGKAHVFYPEANEKRCTAALLLEIDPIGLVRKERGRGNTFALRQYVNDRPYAASSFMSVAIAEVLGTALNGGCRERPELAETPIPLEAHLPVLPCRGGEEVLRKLFEPLGYSMEIVQHPLDPNFPEWGGSRHFSLTLRHTIRLRDLLGHLYVLIPVLDNDKHYWVSRDEVEKLMRHGSGWLEEHPARELIIKRYLAYQRSLANALMERLSDETADPAQADKQHNVQEESAEKKIGLHRLRLERVRDLLLGSGAKSVLDLGCGEGKLLKLLAKEKGFERITGMDLSLRGLEMAQEKLERLPERVRSRVTLLQGSLTYRDQRLEGYDAAAVVEVIEHLEPERLEAFESVLFRHAKPGVVLITTPNSDYNVMWPSLPAGKFRHYDHKFEWSRQEFQEWSERVAAEHGYTVDIHPLGPEEEGIGAPSQIGVFTRCA